MHAAKAAQPVVSAAVSIARIRLVQHWLGDLRRTRLAGVGLQENTQRHQRGIAPDHDVRDDGRRFAALHSSPGGPASSSSRRYSS